MGGVQKLHVSLMHDGLQRFSPSFVASEVASHWHSGSSSELCQPSCLVVRLRFIMPVAVMTAEEQSAAINLFESTPSAILEEKGVRRDVQASYRPIFTKIPKYYLNTSNGTETITVSILFRRLKNTVFLPSPDWQYSVYNRGPRGTANAQRFFYWRPKCRCMSVPSQVCCGKVALLRARLRVGACTDRL